MDNGDSSSTTAEHRCCGNISTAKLTGERHMLILATNVSLAQGISALFHGDPGTGKTLAAEAIGFDVGRPLMVVSTWATTSN